MRLAPGHVRRGSRQRVARAAGVLFGSLILSSACDSSADLPDKGAVQSDASPHEVAPASTEGARLDGAVLSDASSSDEARAEPAGSSLDAGVGSDAAPRLSELVETVFVPGCILGRCHTTLAPAGELSFTGRRISVHAALVNAASSALADRVRVVPFDPDASYLMEKLESDAPAAGTRMPPIAPLPQQQIDRVRAWIAAGALDD